MPPLRPPLASRPLRLGKSAPAAVAVALCVAALAVVPARAADPRCGPPGEAPAPAGSAAPAGPEAAAQEPAEEQPSQGQAKQEQPSREQAKQEQAKQAQAERAQEKERAAAGGPEKLQVYEQILVTGRGSDMVGIAASASQGMVGPQELEQRPILRPGEVLETVPGLIVSQHSGDGKANQYYLRGFNLDHGTDFSITVDGIPINQPTNGHGQGYSDLNFLIPELIDTVRYEKGLYYADKGDFSAAGAADITFKNALDQGLVEATGGTHGFARGLLADSARVGRGDLLAALEYEHNDGPWVRPDDYLKKNGLVRYNRGDAANGFTVTMQGYDGTWNATDQVPSRAVREGLVSRLGGIDPTDGGSSSRYSLAGELRRGGDASLTTLSGFVYDTRLRLFSDFTYFLADPVHGDQFEQFDDRTVEGVKLEHQWAWRLFGRDVEGELGVQARHDGIHNGILHTEDRRVLSTTREDTIQETSVGPYGQAQVRWTEWLRTIAGLRADAYRFRVDSNLAANSGFRDRAIAEPKLSLLLGPWQASEFYLNFGEGFHSNDARGATIAVDPRTGQPVGPVSPLVRAKSADAGFRTSPAPGLQASITFFRLDLASELVFDGDAGDTAPSRPSRRLGFELQSFYRPSRWLALDADYSRSRARFTDLAATGATGAIGDHIPGAIGSAAAIGVTVPDAHRFFGSLRWRYFGPRPLIEDASVRSHSTSLFYLDAGCTLPRNLRLTVEVFNLFDVKASDVDYYYTSRLPGEPAAGVPDVHFHPAEPRSVRLVVAYRF
jgi:hypothetical protein